MSRTIRLLVATTLITAGCVSGVDSSESVAPLTTTDVDIAPECAGLLTYTNTASFATLDAYLPSNVAQAIVATAASNPFDSIAELLTIDGLGATRLQQLLAHARSDGFVGPSCDGIYDNLGVSQDDAASLVAYVNSATQADFEAILAFMPFPQQTVTNLLANRPFANAGAISNTSGVGPAVFRALRNAANGVVPFEALVGAVNSINHPDAQVRIFLRFDWRELVANERITSIICFGIPASELPPGTTIRPNLADGAEVHTDVSQTVETADRLGEVSAQLDPQAGLDDLEERVDGHTFRGCYIRSSPNPFVFDVNTFFIDIATGFGVQTSIHAVE